MRLLFVDHVTLLRRLERIETIVQFSPEEPLFRHHFPSNPMLPASLLIECFAQAASVLLETSYSFKRKAIPAYLRNAKFHRPIRPAHRLEIRMDIEQQSEDGALLRGTATQEAQPRGACEMGMVTAPLDQFYGAEDADAYRELYEKLLAGAVLEGFPEPPLEQLRREHAV